MIFAKLALDGVGMVDATDATPSGASTLNGAAYMQEGDSTKAYPCISTASVAAADGFIGGFRYTTAGALRVSDVTGGLPASSSINQGILMTDDGQVCYSSAAGTTTLNGVSLTADGAVSMAVMTFLAEFEDLGAGAVDTAVTFGGVSATFTRATTATTVNSAGTIVSVASGTARSYYDPTSLTYLGYLAEGARTNLCLQSETLNVDGSGAPWVHTRITVSTNDTSSPDGTVTAEKMVEDSSASTTHFIQQIIVVAAGVMSLSIFAKAAERSQLLLDMSDNSTGDATALFDLSAGTADSPSLSGSWTNGSSTIKAYPGGWYRCQLTATRGAGTDTNCIAFLAAGGSISYSGNGSSGLYLWGAQLEAAAFASSYIPTTTAAVTRNADVLTYPTTGWLNASAGTLYGQAQVPAIASTTFGVCSINDSSADNAIELHAVATNPFFFVEDATATQANLDAGTITANTTFELVGAYSDNDFAACVDGGTVGTDTSGTIPTVDIINVGTSQNAATPAYGPIRRVAYYNARLPNAKLQRLTSG